MALSLVQGEGIPSAWHGPRLTATQARWSGLVHPAAAEYELLDDEELADLAQSIAEHGQRLPVFVDLDGQVIDGRNRLAACRMAKVDPFFAVFESDDFDIITDFIEDANEHRRNVSAEQVAERRRRRIARKRAAGKSTRQIAQEEGVSQSQVDREIELTRRGSAQSGDEAPEPDRVAGCDGKTYPAKRRTYTDAELIELLAEYEAADRDGRAAIRERLNVKSVEQFVSKARRRLRRDDKTPAQMREERNAAMAARAASGASSHQIAKEFDVHRNTVVGAAKAGGWTIPADEVLGNSHRIDHNRVIEQTVLGAQVDQATLELVDYAALDRDHLEEWVSLLGVAIRSLTTIKRNLTKELTRGEQ